METKNFAYFVPYFSTNEQYLQHVTEDNCQDLHFPEIKKLPDEKLVVRPSKGS